jgi:pimeloyl-ACP methyl ester carboxylesterase
MKRSNGLSAVKLGAIAVCLGILAQGCAHPTPAGPPRPPGFIRDIALNGFPVTLHLTPAVSPEPLPLLIYATGDGGWRGKDVDVYRQLIAWGYPTAGFSAPQYVKHLKGDAETTTPARLARDYAAVIDLAEEALMLPASTRVILVGVSRGAGLSVVAAGQRALQGSLEGVVAMGLTKEEEHVRWRRRRQPPSELEIYEYLPLLGSLPIAVIQSTHDNYLPAESARALFGADTDRRQFHAIEAKNHSFADARASLYEAIRASLIWMTNLSRRGRESGSNP